MTDGGINKLGEKDGDTCATYKNNNLKKLTTKINNRGGFHIKFLRLKVVKTLYF